MKKVIPVFNIGDLVFAKVRGYPAWPAKVISVADEKGTKYQVFFYGTYETAVVKRDEIWLFNEETKKRFGKQKRRGFAEGLSEIENNPNIALSGSVDPADNVEEAEAVPSTSVTSDEPSKPGKCGDSLPDDAPLTIDESGPAAKLAPAKKSVKRKAEATISTPVSEPTAKVARTSSPAPLTPIGMAVATPGKKSRSGRVIKPKKFVDETATPVKSQSSDNLERIKQEPRKMWVHVKSTGYMLEMNLDNDRPISFDSKDAEIQWEKATARNALKFKEAVESGQLIPEQIKAKLLQKLERTPEEEELLSRERQLIRRREKIRWLKVEQCLIDIDMAIKTVVHYEHPDMKRCLELLDDLNSLPIAALMLKKHPEVVTTIRKLRKYIGPQSEPEDPKMAQEWHSNAEKIRLKADSVFHKIQSCFATKEGCAFWDIFEQSVIEFKESTKDLEENKILHMVSDPTSKKKDNV